MTSPAALFDRLPWTSDEPVFDALILVGPVLLLAIAVLGRNVVTRALAAAYLVSIALAVALVAARERS